MKLAFFLILDIITETSVCRVIIFSYNPIQKHHIQSNLSWCIYGDYENHEYWYLWTFVQLQYDDLMLFPCQKLKHVSIGVI